MTARMAAFIPGALPPLVSTATRFVFFVASVNSLLFSTDQSGFLGLPAPPALLKVCLQNVLLQHSLGVEE
jgi:hypothetical protein